MLNFSEQSDWQGTEQQWQQKIAPENFITRQHYDTQGGLLQQIDADGNIQQQSYNHAGQLIARLLQIKDQLLKIVLQSADYAASGQDAPAEIGNNELLYSINNQIGSCILELDEYGQLSNEEELLPFGGTAWLAAENQLENHYKAYRYSGKGQDATGLYYYGFCYYQPWVGWWLNPDPAGIIDGLNLYRMVRNNPVNNKEIHGLMP